MILKSISESFSNSDEFKNLVDIIDNRQISIEGIASSSFSFIISSVFSSFREQILVITENYQKMQELFLDISCFADPGDICVFPPWETLPYEYVSPSEKIDRERVTTLYRLTEKIFHGVSGTVSNCNVTWLSKRADKTNTAWKSTHLPLDG